METQVLASPGGRINKQTAQKNRLNDGLLQTGETIDGYVVRRLLSSAGGEAEIYLCEKDNQKYVLKYFYTRSPDPEILKKLLSFSGKHPGIVSYKAAGIYKERHFLILEYAEGGALDDKKTGAYKYLPVSEGAALQIIKEVVNAFEVCHKNGIIHRDIKPGNLFYKNADGSNILIGDFGIASSYEADKGLSKHLTKTGGAHTIGYAAPELFGGHKNAEVVIGPEVDYYALGVTLWALLTGKDPFVNEKGDPLYEGQIALNAIQGKTADLLLARSPTLSGRMRTLIRGLLTHRHDKRWGCQEIRRFLAGENVEVFTEAARDLPPFEIAGQKYYDYPSVALALLTHPDEGKTLVFQGKLVAWLIRIDQVFAEKILDLTETYSAGNRLKEGLVFIAYSLCPSLPFPIGGGKKISSLLEMTSLLETDPGAIIPCLRNETQGFYTYLDAVGLGEIGQKVREVVKAVPDDFKLVPRITLALRGNIIMPFQDGINNNLELREIEQLYNLPEYLKERTLLFIERRCGDLPAWIENLTGRNLENWLWKLMHQKRKLLHWGKWKYFSLFLQGNDIQSGGSCLSEKGDTVQYGFEDPFGNVLLPAMWDYNMYENISGSFIVRKNGLWGLVLSDGSTAIDFKYKALEVFNEEKRWYLAEDEYSAHAIISEKDEVVYKNPVPSSLRWEGIPGNPFEFVYGAVNKSEKRFLLSKDFRLVREFEDGFSEIVVDGKAVYIWYKEHGKVFICKGSGEVLQETPFSDFTNAGHCMVVKQNNVCGLAGGDGAVSIPCRYDRIEPNRGFSCIFQNGKWGALDTEDDTVIHPCEYATVQYNSGYYSFEKEGVYRLYSAKHSLLYSIEIKNGRYSISGPGEQRLLDALYIIGFAEEFDEGGYSEACFAFSRDWYLYCFDGNDFLGVTLDGSNGIIKRNPDKKDAQHLMKHFDGNRLWQIINNLKKQGKTGAMNLMVNAVWFHFHINQEWETVRRILFFINPDNMEGLDFSYDFYRYTIGCTLLSQENHEDALDFFEEAVRINPEAKGYYVNYGLAYFGLGKGDKALEYAEKALAIEPDKPLLWFNKGLFLSHSLHRYNEAAAAYSQAIELGKKEDGNIELPLFYKQRGEAYKALGMWDNVTADFAEANRLGAEKADSVPGKIIPGSKPVSQEISDKPASFVQIPGGTFMMGSLASEAGRNSNETQHTVTVSGFSMGKYPVTQKEYQEVMGNNPGNFKGDTLPVEQVSWYDAIEYCNKRSRQEGLSSAYTRSGDNVSWDHAANGYRLPTEAEWEYACRAGTTTPYSSGSSVDKAGWYEDNSGGKTHPVGEKQANAWGLYDMHGNVREWCWDWYGGDYSSGAQTDPVGASSGSNRVGRGGSWRGIGQNLRSAFRNFYAPSDRYNHLGFRLVRSE